MNVRLLTTLLLCLGLFTTELMAQIQPVTLSARTEDAIRFTNFFPVGSARFAGTGGSMTPMGVDFTTLSTNPAGIGWNRTSFASVTGGFSLTSVDANLRSVASNNQDFSESRGVPTLPSLGVIVARQPQYEGQLPLNYSLALNRVADFNETIDYEGFSDRSIVDALVEDINDGFFDPFRSQLLTNQIQPNVLNLPIAPAGTPFPVDNIFQRDDIGFFSIFDTEGAQGAELERRGRVERTGSMYEFVAGAATNFNNRVLIGASLGIPFFNFEETRRYEEIDVERAVEIFDDASFEENLAIDGNGLNFKLGAIFIPTLASRVSLAIHSPTFWTLEETFTTRLTLNYTSLDGAARGGSGVSPEGLSTVNLQTPWRFQAGLGHLIGRYGFVSVDAEYVNYAGNQFSFDDFATPDDFTNDAIDNTLDGSLSVRAGAEVNLDPIQVRAGVGYRQLPVQEARFGEDENLLSFSGGVGYNAGEFFVDLAVTAAQRSTYFAPYRTFTFPGQVVDTDRFQLRGLVTVGYRGF